MKDVKNIFINLNDTIEDVIKTIQRGGVGLALVVDKEGSLLGTLTDGDVRRAILNKMGLENKLDVLMNRRAKPLVARLGTSQDTLLKMMKEKVVRQIPLLNEKGHVVELALLSELVEEKRELSLTAVVMAGGRGQRLYPLTKATPKPMLPINGIPLMHKTIEQLRDVGIKKVQISTHYKSDMIMNYFGNGRELGVDIHYIHENQPMGTAGALGLMEIPKETTLVMNGDILTQLDFRTMYDFHQTHKALMTVGLRKYEVEVPYGVVQTDDILITHLVEKPRHSFLVNAGIYLIEPEVYEYIPKEKYFDMTDLITRLLEKRQRVISFPIQEYWLDVGLHEDYKRAQEDIENGKL